MSILFGIIGLFVEPVYINDWWKPLTITNTAIGIEDFLFGFSLGGISAVIYETFSKQRVKIKKTNKKQKKNRNINFLIIMAIAAFLFLGGFYLFKLNTFYSTLLAFIIPTLIIWVKRRDLIVNSLVSGVMTLILAIIIYSIIGYFTPGWIDEFLFFENIPRIIFLNMPLDDIIWFFLAGLWIGPLYEYWKEAKLIKYKP